MAHPHAVMNFPPLPGSPTVHRSNPFQNLTFPECPNEPPLDLNFVQKLTQNTVRTQNEPEMDATSQPQQIEFEASSSPHQDLMLKVVPEGVVVANGTPDGPPAKGDVVPSKVQRSRCHWTHGEVMALFDAKKAQADRLENEKVIKKGRSSVEHWNEVAEFCKNAGVTKLASQCKDKWERIWPAFRKILDWERNPPAGKSSYWTMLGDEREQEGFPRVFDKELYDAMASRFGFVRTFDLASIVVDSSIEDPVDVTAAANNTIGPVENGAIVFEESPSVVDDQAPASAGRKRKAAARLAPVKQSPTENKKLETSEENGPAKASKDQQAKGKTAVDLSERRMAMEERRLKLAEKRLSLEERKLEATIEIGRGLITSMERMTSAISTLGVFSAPHG